MWKKREFVDIALSPDDILIKHRVVDIFPRCGLLCNDNQKTPLFILIHDFSPTYGILIFHCGFHHYVYVLVSYQINY